MSKFREKPVVIEALTFEEFVEYGKAHAPLINGMPWSFEINGYAISHETDDCYLITTLEGTHRMTRSDMLIIGVKGEIYPCKLDIFAATYEPAARAGALNFSGALEALKAGHRVAREGWNGKGMWIALTPGYVVDTSKATLHGALAVYARQPAPVPVDVTIGAHIDMKAADGSLVIGWFASQTDMLAEDWMVLS